VPALIAVLGLATACGQETRPHPRSRLSDAGTAARFTSSGVETTPPRVSTRSTSVPVRARVGQVLSALVATRPGVRASVAVLNTATGTTYSWGAGSGMWTASVYKLLVLETLLSQHRRARTPLSPYEIDAATRMIVKSSDKVGYALYLDIGGAAGLAQGLRLMGMRHTVPGRVDPTFTTTSARDCVAALRQLVSPGRIDVASRRFALRLMQGVQADQRWGVGVVADAGTRFANKNGWLGVDDTNGAGTSDHDRWVVNSLGVVTVAGKQVLMAVLTEHNPDRDSGVELVEAMARATLPVIRR
jgi:beta-lactamase class A